MNQFLDFDQKLYAELRKGSEHAFVTVFERYNRLLYALAYRYFKSGEEAEDAVQYTFMKLWEQRSSFEFQSGIRKPVVHHPEKLHYERVETSADCL